MEIPQLRPTYLQSDDELVVTLDTVEAARRILDTYYLDVVDDVESRGLARELGAKNTIELLELRHRRDPADTRNDLTFLKNLPKYEAVVAALTVADDDPTGLTADHAKVIVTTLDKAPSTVPAETLRVAEEQMIQAARYLTPSGLRDFGRQVLDRLDTDGPEPAEDDAYQKESLRIRPADHGIKFSGYLAGANAEHFKTAIHDLAKPHRTADGNLDPRSHEKRQADALTTILDIATGADPTTGIPGVPHLTVTIDFTDLKALTSAAVGELVFGDNLSAAAVRLLACDAAVLPIVLGTDSQPLDVGTEYRFVTRPIRRALNRRDKGCVICKAPPSHCHAHHLIHWVDGGPTAISNLVLLCGAHHRAVHAGHWTVTITNGKVHITRPHWTIPTPTRLTMPAPSPNTPRPPNAPSGPTTPPNPGTPSSPGTSPNRGTPSIPSTPTGHATPQSTNASASAATPPSPNTSANPDTPFSASSPEAPSTAKSPPSPGSLTLDGTAAAWLAPLTAAAAWSQSVSVNPHNAQPYRLRPTTVTPTNLAATGLSWLTPEAVTALNPWGESGIPSTGP
ncbi:DUF222 domain-containing protein [Kribbella sp. NPDC051620]|uniref:HNH endonuclease signature motif containing protein n=1 Tax=Kribbella sp. NPDC051620 TaxID=3364120 RepID=UPI0037B7E1EC